MLWFRILPALAAFCSALVPASAESFRIDGPVQATLIRVIDGDTILVDANPWPQQIIRVSVRLRGIDAPERRSRCAGEREAAERARLALETTLGGRETLMLSQIAGGKYFGRILAAVEADGRDLSTLMLSAGVVSPYRGGKRQKWPC